MASRNYRQRKKEYISSIEEKLEQLNLENERLRREVNESRHLATKLMHENTELKNVQVCEQNTGDSEDEALNEELMNTELDLKHLIDKLEAGVNSNMDEASMTPLLKVARPLFFPPHSLYRCSTKPCAKGTASLRIKLKRLSTRVYKQRFLSWIPLRERKKELSATPRISKPNRKALKMGMVTGGTNS